jgi:hypothetical protein
MKTSEIVSNSCGNSEKFQVCKTQLPMAQNKDGTFVFGRTQLSVGLDTRASIPCEGSIQEVHDVIE